ncbi:MAG: ATP-binding cassette domain-containing protein [Candidatus Lokiarchaeota archaeon]|nr:ATP-binding cassette domain-containing protein [Candidatus Lokiarchaeota archaeon]
MNVKKDITNKKIIKVDNLNLSFGKKHVLKDISFYCDKGDILGLMGISGAGKTTIVRVLASQISHFTGKVICAGIDLKSRKSSKVLEKIGYVPQLESLNLYHKFSALKNVRIFGSMYGLGKKASIEKGKEIFDILEIPEDTWKSKVKSMSGGEKKRVSIALGLINNPEVLFLDEPTTGVDASRRFDILNYLKKLNSETNITMVIVTHDLETANICDKVVMLKDGRVVDFDDPNELISKLPSRGEILRLKIEGLNNSIIKMIQKNSYVEYVLRVGKEDIEVYMHDIEKNTKNLVDQLIDNDILVNSVTRDDASFKRYFQIRMQYIENA